MRALSSQDILEVYELGERQHPLDRALMLLAVGCPESEQDELAKLSIGQRDALLFALRELTFGPRLDMFSECPSCHEQLKFSMDTPELLADYKTPEKSELHMEAEGYVVRFQLPDSLALAATVNLGMEEAYQTLLGQCMLQASQGELEATLDTLPETVTSALVLKMLECDPLAEVIFNLDCPACGHRWPIMLDIVYFFWTELELQVKRLLRQVHILAQAYGWPEGEILEMNAWRRQHYIDMVLS